MTSLPHEVQWTTASPLWEAMAKDPRRMQRPALLRFESDQFMAELLALLQDNPASLVDAQASQVSYRERPPGAAADWLPAPPPLLRLYQPAHGHFYLAAASLVCRLPGLPDHGINPGNQEKVVALLRRCSAGGSEFARVNTQDAATGKKKQAWQPVPDDLLQQAQIQDGEELLPMFPVQFGAPGQKRRLWLCLIPAAAREALQAAEQMPPPEGDPRKELVNTVIAGGLRDLKNMQPPPGESPEARAQRIAQQKDASRFLMLDLAELLRRKELGPVWDALINGGPTIFAEVAALRNLLLATPAGTSGSPSWLQALQDTVANLDVIAAGGVLPAAVDYNLADSPMDAGEPPVAGALADALNAVLALPALAPPPEPPLLPLPPGEARYLVRCAYLRPKCAPWKAPVISPPSEQFTIAAFFDPEAPARPIRISLPVDTSLAGLRKFKKNVVFLLSDTLRKQLAQGTHLDKGDLAGGDAPCGAFSLSIPIITLCALIILMIFIALFNLIFFWLPLLKICLPFNVNIDLKR